MLTLCFWWQVLLLALYCATTEASPTGELTFLKELMQSLKGLPKDWTDNVTGSDYCKFTGVVCKNESNVLYLKELQLNNVGLFGTLPSQGWADAPRLTVLNMSNNHISGPLPAELFGLTNGQIFLGDNNLNSTLPDILPQFGGTSLRKLHLQGNRFTGCIPKSWTRVNSICVFGEDCKGLNMSDNYFNCTIYECMQYLPKGSRTFCPSPTYVCELGKFCWNIPPTIVLMITLMCGGFMVGNLAMFFATKYVDTGMHGDETQPDEHTPISSANGSEASSPSEQRRAMARSNGALSKSGSGNLNRSSGKITNRGARNVKATEKGDVSFGSIALESQSIDGNSNVDGASYQSTM